jgi:hypothetical protein
MNALKRHGPKLKALEANLHQATQAKERGPSPEEQIKLWRQERAELNECISKDLELIKNFGVSPTLATASPKAPTKGILGSFSKLKSPFGSASSLNKKPELSVEEQHLQKHNGLRNSIDKKRERVGELEKLISGLQSSVSQHFGVLVFN